MCQKFKDSTKATVSGLTQLSTQASNQSQLPLTQIEFGLESSVKKFEETIEKD